MPQIYPDLIADEKHSWHFDCLSLPESSQNLTRSPYSSLQRAFTHHPSCLCQNWKAIQLFYLPIPMTSATAHKYVELDPNNIPIIAGTTMKVIELVSGQLANGWSPEELHFQHPYLSMSQIHSALAYYWDHHSELNADIEQRERYAAQLQQAAGSSPLVQKLRAQGLI
jgi:uncharacterized protein (DUF433 family)